jgi:TolB-like protein/Tfp pilus assembly protein PilF
VTGIVLWAMKRYAEALPHLRRFNEMIPDSPYAKYQLCFGLAGAGRMTEARKVLAEMKALARKAYVKPHFLGLACVAVGDFDEAFEHFEQSFAEDDPWMLWFGVEPMLEALRGDERYVDLLRRLDNPLAEKYASLPKATENKKSEAPKSIAVLPLRIFGVETGERTSDEYLSIGLADAMISRLSNVRRLMVRPTSSILHLREATDAFEAGRALAVNYVLTGTVHRVGGRIRISAQLLDVKSKAAIWAENFDEHFTDVLDLEDTVAEKVANLLIPKLTGEEKKQLQKRGTNSPAAYEAYMRGRYLANQFTNEAFVKSFAAFEDAVRLDPDYTLPRVGMAEFYVWSSVFGTLSSHEAYPKAKEALMRALAIDDRLAEAYALQSFVALLYDWNWADAERLVRKALEINPNHSFAHNTLAHVLATKGAGEEALREIRIAESLDPLSPLAKVMTSCISYQSRHFEEAATKARQASDMQLTFPQAFLHLGNALPHCGAATEAVEVLTTLSELWRDSPVPKFMLCFALVAAGETEKAQDVARGIASLAEKQFVKPYFVAMAQAAVGERGRAFEWFEKAVDERDEWMIWFGTDVKLEPLRGDERYFEILRRTNNPIAARLRRKTEKTIAVLPLRLFGAPTGASSEDEYLGVGLADAMISRLSNVRRLMVRPTSSILQFANAADDFEAGRELGADYVLTGTMRRAGGRIRISAQLLDVQSKAAIWAENFNEELTDVLDLEDVVAERVANLLIPKLTGDERQKLARRRTDSPEAFEAYLRGRYHLFQATPREFAKAKIYFEEAVRLDADYALAYTGLAEYYFVLGAFAPVSPVECYSKAREMAQRALAIDDSLGEAYATLGHLAISNFELEKAARLLERSVELSPNHSLAAMWRSILFVCYGRYNEAVAESRRAIELNPLGAFEKAHHAFILYQARRFDEATAAGRRAIADDPNFSHGIGTVSWIFRSMGLTGEAVELARRAVETSGGNPWLVCNLAACLGKAGETETARGILRDLESSTETFVLPCRMAIAYFNVGDADRTIAELEKAYEMKDPLLVWLSSEPEIDSLRADERLIDLERRVKNAQFSKSAD